MNEKLTPGKKISFELEGATHSGLVLPNTNEKILFIKLENGYNIGVNPLKITNVKIIGKQSAAKAPTLKASKNLPKVTIISTGGTITSRLDYQTGAVNTLTSPEELLAQIPELAKIANLKIISSLNIMSEDVTFEDWKTLAKLVNRELQDKSVRGVVITHGTDTLHFTSAALAFMLGNLEKPVAVVGAQRSSDRGSFDGAQNLICAVHYALSDIKEVAVVMHGSIEDTYCLAISGVKARKMHSSRRDAFRPINAKPLAKIYPDGRIERGVLNSHAATKFDVRFEEKIALIKFSPNQNPNILDFYTKQGYRGIILEGTGLGHVAKNWLPFIKRAIKRGVLVCMTSQCIYGRVDPYVYSPGRKLAEAGVIYLEDMLAEVAYVKLGIALGREKNSGDAALLMLANLAGEISERIENSTYLY